MNYKQKALEINNAINELKLFKQDTNTFIGNEGSVNNYYDIIGINSIACGKGNYGNNTYFVGYFNGTKTPSFLQPTYS